jgi:hypothetical protein
LSFDEAAWVDVGQQLATASVAVPAMSGLSNARSVGGKLSPASDLNYHCFVGKSRGVWGSICQLQQQKISKCPGIYTERANVLFVLPP